MHITIKQNGLTIFFHNSICFLVSIPFCTDLQPLPLRINLLIFHLLKATICTYSSFKVELYLSTTLAFHFYSHSTALQRALFSVTPSLCFQLPLIGLLMFCPLSILSLIPFIHGLWPSIDHKNAEGKETHFYLSVDHMLLRAVGWLSWFTYSVR